MNAERERLRQSLTRNANWKRWGPYLSERQWGTVREDYSHDGECWTYFPHEQARSRAYRWGEDGLLGFCDRQGRLCFALSLWNGRDPILKERLFGLTGPEGNHGEDVKECYYYLDSTPTHSYVRGLYKYPQPEFPYAHLVSENQRRSRFEPEFELADTGVFEGNRYFDVFCEYAKAAPNDVLIRVTVANRGPQTAALHLLPTLWFRNTWSWGCTHEGCEVKPRMERQPEGVVVARHVSLGVFRWRADVGPDGKPPVFLFTDNETNAARLFNVEESARYPKDAFHDFLIAGRLDAVNPRGIGTKAAAVYFARVPAGESLTFRLRLTGEEEDRGEGFGPAFDRVFDERIAEADEFFDDVLGGIAGAEERRVSRLAYAGLLWTKQFYHYVVKDWIEGDPDQPKPPPERKTGRNNDWPHLFNRDLLAVPDKWEYPWFAAWDLAFHMIPFSRIDPDFAKEQLILLLREWYMHPNGQIPAYEFCFSDVNPPVHAWACWRVYKMTGKRGERDVLFLRRVFKKLLLNFTWWVNRKDVAGKHLFAGGFLGLDNVGVFDRSKPLPTGGHLEQADGTAWMAFYCGTMLAIALELAQDDPSYEDIASKFFEHFVEIADAMNSLGGTGLWDDEDGFYYDQIQVHYATIPLRIRSMVGLIPLFAAEVIEDEVIDRLPGFRKRMQWFLDHRPDLAHEVSYMVHHCPEGGSHGHRLLAIPTRQRLVRVLARLFDEREFLSPFGIRSLSKVHESSPYVFRAGGEEHRVDYVPGESTSGLFGGNSNWRGPVWFPVNYLLIEALERYHHFHGDGLRVEFPTGSGRRVTLLEAARALSMRLARLFLPGRDGIRPCHGPDRKYAEDPHWSDLVLFHEYFHGEDGRGLGASHQTGWTALVASLLAKCGSDHAS